MTTFFEIKPNTFLPDWSNEMPRKSATVDSLMSQAEADSQLEDHVFGSVEKLSASHDTPVRLGDLDDAGLERIPEFTDEQPQPVETGIIEIDAFEGPCLTPGPDGARCTRKAHSGLHSWAEPTHEERLAELDARDDRLNGHGVRPSEQCGILAGGGPYPGRRCTYREHPMNQPHSWEVASDPTDLPGHVYDDDEAAQPTLPGTPEPEATEFTIPREGEFKGADYQSAPGLKSVGDRLIAETEEFSHLVGIEIRYFWKRRGGRRGGNLNFGSLQKAVGRARYALGNPVYFLDLSADHCRDQKFTDEQLTALVFDRLARAAVDPEDHSAYRVVGADFEGMALTVRRFGLWNVDLRESAASLRQLPLDQELDLPELDEAEPEEGEAGDEHILASLEASEGGADE